MKDAYLKKTETDPRFFPQIPLFIKYESPETEEIVLRYFRESVAMHKMWTGLLEKYKGAFGDENDHFIIVAAFLSQIYQEKERVQG